MFIEPRDSLTPTVRWWLEKHWTAEDGCHSPMLSYGSLVTATEPEPHSETERLANEIAHTALKLKRLMAELDGYGVEAASLSSLSPLSSVAVPMQEKDRAWQSHRRQMAERRPGFNPGPANEPIAGGLSFLAVSRPGDSLVTAVCSCYSPAGRLVRATCVCDCSQRSYVLFWIKFSPAMRGSRRRNGVGGRCSRVVPLMWHHGEWYCALLGV